MTDEQLIFQAANAADQALKITKAAWEAQELPPPLADELDRHAELLRCASLELKRRGREVATTVARMQ